MDLSYATIRDLAQRYAAKKKATGTVNKTTSTVDTIMKSLRQQYERHTGERNADMLGDLAWLTPASLKKPSESARLRPLYRGKHHPSASEANKVPLEAATVKRMLENFRSAIYGVFYHLKTLDGDHDTVLQKLKDSYDEFGTMADGLKREQAEQLLTREPSKHQEASGLRSRRSLPIACRRLPTTTLHRCNARSKWPSTSCSRLLATTCTGSGS